MTGGDLPRGIAEVVEADDQGDVTLFYNRRINTSAQRVAIAHGLGHIVFGDLARRRCSADGRHRPAEEHAERRADLVAAELLVPLHELDPAAGPELFPREPVAKQAFDDSVDQLASWFQVPPGFVRWRLWDLVHLRRSNFRIP